MACHALLPSRLDLSEERPHRQQWSRFSTSSQMSFSRPAMLVAGTSFAKSGEFLEAGGRS